MARAVIAGRATTFTLGSDRTFTPDSGGLALPDHVLRALALIPGQQITYTCLPPGWPH